MLEVCTERWASRITIKWKKWPARASVWSWSTCPSSCEALMILKEREALVCNRPGRLFHHARRTNGAHLTSFSLTDILSHGRACGLMTLLHRLLCASIQQPLRLVGRLCKAQGTRMPQLKVDGRELGVAVAEALIAFEKASAPDNPWRSAHISATPYPTCAGCAKTPQLKMKLETCRCPSLLRLVDELHGAGFLWRPKPVT